MTRASVVIPSRGGAQRLPRLLESLAAQTHADTEVVVVLDGDVDGSAAVLEPWSDRLDLRVITFPENRGRSAALNAGFAGATGGVLIRCDDDLEPAEDYVAGHVSAHLGPVVGVIGLYLNVYPDSAYARAYGRRADVRFRDTAYRVPPESIWRYWAGNVSTTAETFHRVGAYDTGYRTYGWEDVDWGYRLHSLGVPVKLVPQLETIHRIPSTTAWIRSKRAYLSGAARNTFEDKHGVEAFGPAPRPRGVWGAAVRALAHLENEARIERIARLVDGALAHVPPSVGEKMVALLVESASRAGHDRPSTNRTIL